MFTPHYIEDSKYVSNKDNNKNIINSIIKYAKDKYNINIFLGNEVYFNNNIIELYKNGEITTLNNSRYMLIEIPMYSKINNLKSSIFEIISYGIIPIIAHPERYESYYKDFDFFIELHEMGVLFQLNYASLIGTYGRKAKYMAKKLLKLNLISFLGSDIHSPKENKYDYLNKCLNIIKKYVSQEDFTNLTENNFARIIYDKEI
jgi:protein-tyrosine phosphatase